MDKSQQDYYSSGFKLSKQLQKKQEELLQTKFNVSKNKMTSAFTKDENIPMIDQTERNQIDNRQKSEYVMPTFNQPTVATRFTPNLNAASEIDSGKHVSFEKPKIQENPQILQEGEEPEMEEEKVEIKQPEKLQEKQNLLMKNSDNPQSRIEQFANRDRRPILPNTKKASQSSKVIFGNPGTTSGFKVGDPADSDEDDENLEKNKKITETFVNENLKNHQQPIELPFHCELQKEVQVIDTDINKFHNVDHGQEFTNSLITHDNWNLLQIPNENLFNTTQMPNPTEEETESLENINYEDKFALLRHLNGLEYDSCGFLINKNNKNYVDKSAATTSPSPNSINELLKVGKLKLYKSGKIKLFVGNKKYLIAGGTNVNFKQSVLGLNHNNRRGYYICDVDKKFISIST